MHAMYLSLDQKLLNSNYFSPNYQIVKTEKAPLGAPFQEVSELKNLSCRLQTHRNRSRLHHLLLRSLQYQQSKYHQESKYALLEASRRST